MHIAQTTNLKCTIIIVSFALIKFVPSFPPPTPHFCNLLFLRHILCLLAMSWRSDSSATPIQQVCDSLEIFATISFRLVTTPSPFVCGFPGTLGNTDRFNCSLGGPVTTVTFQDDDSIDFSSMTMIGSLPNPLVFTGDSWPVSWCYL